MNKKIEGDSASAQEAKVERHLQEQFSVLTVIGGVYGFYRSPRWSIISYSMYITMYTCSFLISADLLYSSIVLRNNISLFTVAFHAFLINCVVLTGSVSLTLQRRRTTEFLYNFDFTGYWTEYQESKFFVTLEAQSRRRILQLLILFLSGYCACGMIGVVGPFVDMRLGIDENVTNVTGIYWKGLPFAMWWPFDAHKSTISWISCFMCQGLWASFAPLMCTSAIILCFNSCEKLLNHMKLLIYAIEHLDLRAKNIFKKKFKYVTPDKQGIEYDDCYYECIVQNVKHHQKIVKAIDDFMILANYAIAVPFFGGGLLLGLAGLNILSRDDPRVGPKLFCASLGMTEALNMLLLCVYGEKFQHEGEKLFTSIMYTKWYTRSLKCRKALMILQCGTLRPVKITAAKLIVLNMATFANLTNSAYSIFNLNSVVSSGE
uniref:Odorant receptor n=1 Tax=Adelphocoris lineolatus TaxID=236346 RepID=A0A2I4PH15_ADELI|nr:olfactory receptor 18 [Adelphocoris lineolatus]